MELRHQPEPEPEPEPRPHTRIHRSATHPGAGPSPAHDGTTPLKDTDSPRPGTSSFMRSPSLTSSEVDEHRRVTGTETVFDVKYRHGKEADEQGDFPKALMLFKECLAAAEQDPEISPREAQHFVDKITGQMREQAELQASIAEEAGASSQPAVQLKLTTSTLDLLSTRSASPNTDKPDTPSSRGSGGSPNRRASRRSRSSPSIFCCASPWRSRRKARAPSGASAEEEPRPGVQ